MSDFHAGRISRENIYVKLKLVKRLNCLSTIVHCTCCSRVVRSWQAVLFLRERGARGGWAREEADTRELWLESWRLSDLLSSSSSSSNSSASSTSSWGQNMVVIVVVRRHCVAATATLLKPIGRYFFLTDKKFRRFVSGNSQTVRFLVASRPPPHFRMTKVAKLCELLRQHVLKMSPSVHDVKNISCLHFTVRNYFHSD